MNRSSSRRRAGLTLTDIIICMVLLAMLFAVGVPVATYQSKETANRVICASNLRQIGQAMLWYSNDNRGQWPRTIYDPANPTPTQFTGVEAPDPFGPGGPAPNDVTAALFLLIRTQDIGTEVFICPSDSARRDNLGGKDPAQRSNFTKSTNLSYSLANPYPTTTIGYRWNISQNPEFVVMADMNPGVPELLTITWASRAEQVKLANSFNHRGDGQNVLFGDGHAEFVNTPFFGVQKDNIYTAGLSGWQVTPPRDLGPGTTIGGTPAHMYDSVLIPFLPPGTPRPGGLLGNAPLSLVLSVLVGILLLAGAAIAVVWIVKGRKPGDPAAPPAA